MNRVKSLETGEIVPVDDAELPSLVTTGKYAIPDGEYDFENQLGERIKVGAADFQTAVESGYKYINESVKREERLDAEFGDSPVRAAAEGVARSLTLGVSDQLFTDKEGVRERKERNAIASGLGEGLGIVAPILATGGAAGVARGIGAKILQKTGAGQVARLAAAAGKGAGSLVKNEIGKGAVKLGVEGAIEGALLGVGKTISEDGLGDTEFSAEALMGNVGLGAASGAAFGGIIGATGGVISKIGRGALRKTQLKAIEELDVPAADKAALKEQFELGKKLDTTNELFENPELKQAIQDLGYKAEPTTSVLSPIESTKRLGTSIADNLSIPGIIERKQLDNFVQETQKKAATFFDSAKDTTPYDLGNRARQEIMGGINERLRPAQDALGRIYQDVGEAPVRDRGMKLLESRLRKNDLVVLKMDKGLAQRIGDTIPYLTTVNRVNTFKKAIGKEMSMAYRTGDTNQASILSDIYDSLSRVERLGIEDAAMAAGPKMGPKLAKQYLGAYDEAMGAYRGIYKEYSPLAEQLGTKLKRPDDFLDWLENLEAEKLGGRLVDLNDYDSALKLNKDFPELFDIARGRKLADFMKKVQDKNQAISPAKFVTAVNKMTPQEKQILFGFEAASQKRLKDITTVMKNLPPGYGSDTARNLAFMDVLNPLFQGKELLRYAMYKGGDKAIRQYLLKTVPVVTEVENQINRTKGSISSAVNGFYRSSGATVAVGALALSEDKKTENAKKIYEQIYQDPQSFVDRFVLKNKDLTESAPNVSAALQAKMLAGMRFLQSKVPSKQTDFASHEYTPSRSELLSFQEYVEAVEKPMKVFEKMKNGYISPRHIEALKVVYPKLYSSLQEDLNAKMPKKLSTYQKTMLQQILGVKVSPTASYEVMQLINTPQGQPQQQAPQRKVPVSAAQNFDVAGRAQTGLDRTVYRT